MANLNSQLSLPGRDFTVTNTLTIRDGTRRQFGTITVASGATLFVNGTLVCNQIIQEENSKTSISGTLELYPLVVAPGSETTPLWIDTSGNGDTLTLFVSDSDGGAPADATVIIDRYSSAFNRWMEYGRTEIRDATNPASYESEAIPSKMRVRIINDSSNSTEYGIDMVTA